MIEQAVVSPLDTACSRSCELDTAVRLKGLRATRLRSLPWAEEIAALRESALDRAVPLALVSTA